MSSIRAVALKIKRLPRRVAINVAVAGYHAYQWLPVGATVAAAVRLVEWTLGAVPFVVTLWAGAFWRGAVAGWRVSAADDAEKRKVLRELLGGDEQS